MDRTPLPEANTSLIADGGRQLADALVTRARSARNYAVTTTESPTTIGAAVRLADGTAATGTDILGPQSAASIHAEEVALGTAVRYRSFDDTRPEVTHIALVSNGDDLPRPCPDCKLVLKEYATPDCNLVLDNGDTRSIRSFSNGD